MIKLNLIIILAIIVLLVFLYMNNSEHFGAIDTINPEAVKNISSVYNTDNLTATNITASNSLNVPVILNVKKINLDGIILEKDSKGRLAIGGKLAPSQGVNIPICNTIEFEKKDGGHFSLWSSCDSVTDTMAAHEYNKDGAWIKYHWDAPTIGNSINNSTDWVNSKNNTVKYDDVFRIGQSNNAKDLYDNGSGLYLGPPTDGTWWKLRYITKQ